MLPDYVKIKDIKPALSGYLREARSMLNPDIEPDERTVHDVRVLMKKARATLKLLKDQVDEAILTREYNTCREAAGKMSEWRESSVHRKILKELRKRHSSLFIQLQENEKISSLFTRPDAVREPSSEIRDKIENIINLIAKSGYRLRFQTMNNLDPHKLLKELEITYITVMDEFLKARISPKTENIHEFRKKTKDFLYQLYFFRSLKPKVIKDIEKRLDTLTQNLGKCNDLAVLVKTLGYKYNGSGEGNPSMDELIVIIRNEQDRYLAKVWPEACKLFCPGQKLTNLLGYKILVI